MTDPLDRRRGTNGAADHRSLSALSTAEDNRQAFAVHAPHGMPGLTGLRLRDGLTFDDWAEIGARLTRLSQASAWCLGDWMRYGERTYGQRYKRALETTLLDYQTLRNYAWVAGRFAPGRRRTGLSFQHHAEVAALPEASQELWLQRAERARWSRNELRRQLRTAPVATPSDREVSLVVQIQVDPGREQRWRDAAAASSQDLTQWLLHAADEAAERALVAPDQVREPAGLAGLPA